MKIVKVKIEKFRSIKKAEFEANEINAIVGENNAGKTTVLRALNAFFNFEEEKDSFEHRLHQYAPRNNTHIRITFDDIPNQLKQDVFKNKNIIEFIYDYSKNRRSLRLIERNRKPESVTSVEQFITDLEQYIGYVYISVERTNNEISWGNNSVFMELLNKHITVYTQNRDNISSAVRQASKRIHDTALKKLEKSLNDLYMQNKDVDFKVDFPPDIDYKIFSSSVNLSLQESGIHYGLKEWGSGTKSLAIIAMQRANALLEKKDIIWGIEEPEINLHPQAQKRFIKFLRNNHNEYEKQTFFTTHSTVLVDELKYNEILLVRRQKDNTRSFTTCISQVPADFLRQYEMKEERYYKFFEVRSSEFLFSKYVILCESPTDKLVIEQMIEPKVKDQISDIAIVTLDGINNIKYPYFLLKKLGIPFSIVVDKDFLFKYKNGELESSRNNAGLPQYLADVDVGNPSYGDVLLDIFKSKASLQKLKGDQGYRKLFKNLAPYHIFSMQYCLEMDLTCTKAVRDIYYSLLSVPNDKKNQKYLLCDNAKAIKRNENIYEVMNRLSSSGRGYPESFIKIRDALVTEIKRNC